MATQVEQVEDRGVNPALLKSDKKWALPSILLIQVPCM